MSSFVSGCLVTGNNLPLAITNTSTNEYIVQSLGSIVVDGVDYLTIDTTTNQNGCFSFTYRSPTNSRCKQVVTMRVELIDDPEIFKEVNFSIYPVTYMPPSYYIDTLPMPSFEGMVEIIFDTNRISTSGFYLPTMPFGGVTMIYDLIPYMIGMQTSGSLPSPIGHGTVVGHTTGSGYIIETQDIFQNGMNYISIYNKAISEPYNQYDWWFV